MDRTALLLGGVGAVVLLSARLDCWSWLEGRLNGQLSGFMLWLLSIVLWLALVGYLLWRLLRRRGRGGRLVLLSRLLALILAVTPWLMKREEPSAPFIAGFTRWADSSINVEAAREWWSEAIPLGQQAPASPWWPIADLETPLGVPIPSDAWPTEIGCLQPDEVWSLPNQGLLMAWKGGVTGWIRFVFIGSHVSEHPEVFIQDRIIWRPVEPGVYVGIYLWHY